MTETSGKTKESGLGIAAKLVVAAWFVGALALLGLGLINSILTFLFDVTFLPEEMMRSERGVWLTVVVAPILAGGVLAAIWMLAMDPPFATEASGESNDESSADDAEADNAVDLDEFGAACFRAGITEEFEPRTARDFPEIRAIDDAAAAGERAEALDLATAAIREHSDAFWFPVRAAELLQEDGKFDEASRVLNAALPSCKSKANICDRLGAVAREQGETKEALRWWITATYIQLSSGRPVFYAPYLRLSYLAQALDLSDVGEFLKHKSDRMSPTGPIDFNAAAIDELRQMALSLDADSTKSVRTALQLLVGRRSIPDPVSADQSPAPISRIARAPVNRGAGVPSCPLCGSRMIDEPNHVHCDSGHSKIVVHPLDGSFLARSAEVAATLEEQGHRVKSSGGERPMFVIYPR